MNYTQAKIEKICRYNDKDKKKIFIVGQPDVTTATGGAISIFIELCNLFSRNNYKTYGVCYSKKNKQPENIDKDVYFINLRYTYTRQNISYSNAINRLIESEKPDLIIFFYPSLLVDAKLKEEFNSIPKILMFHSRPDFYFADRSKLAIELKECYTNTIAQILFPNFKELLPKFIKDNNVICIPNGIKLQKIRINTNIEHKKIIYLSRIDCCKGIEFLINSFKLISKKYPDWQIDIYGQSSPKRYVKKLEKLVLELGLQNQIFFKGVTDKPIRTMYDYDFCVFPSYFEGFGIGLAEALSVGLPSIGLKGCTGVNELIIDGVNGFLCDDNFLSYAEKMEELILSKEIREKMSIEAQNSVKKYDINIIQNYWLKLVKSLIKDSSENYIPFPLKKILEKRNQTYSFWQNIFSLKKEFYGIEKYKVLRLLGTRIRLNRVY